MANTFNFSFTPPSFPAAKKPRVLFSEEQKEALRLAFSMDPYPSTTTIEFLANELNLSVRTITNWFHNHRMRLKQNSNSPEEPVKMTGDGLLSLTNSLLPGVREGATFDPVQFRTLLSRRMMDLQSQKGSSGGGSIPYTFPFALYRNCSPVSNAADDSGTLDLSMSSSHHNARSDSISSLRSDAHGGSIADDHSSSDMNEDSCFSQDPGGATEGSDHESLDEAMVSSPAAAAKLPRHGAVATANSGSTGGGSVGGGSSNRRKPAMPQWVNPGLEMSPDSASDLDDDLEDEDSHEIINGVCVRQMDDFALRIPREEATVRLEPAPAPDLEIQTVTDLRNMDKRKIFSPNGVTLQPQEVQPIDLERKLNITRLEKCVKEVVDEWGDDSDQGESDLKAVVCDAKDAWDSFNKLSSSSSS